MSAESYVTEGQVDALADEIAQELHDLMPDSRFGADPSNPSQVTITLYGSESKQLLVYAIKKGVDLARGIEIGRHAATTTEE